MNCRAARKALLRAADGALPIEERLALDAHAGTCPRCGPLARALARLEEGFVRLPEPPLEQLDLDAEVRAVRERFDRTAAPAHTLRSSRTSAWWIAAAAAAALVAGYALLAPEREAPAPEIAEPAPRPAEPAPGADVELPDLRAVPADGDVDADGAPRLASTERTAHAEGDADGDAPAEDCDTPTESVAGALQGTESELAVDAAPPGPNPPPPTPPTPAELERLESARAALGACLVAALETDRASPRAELERSFARCAAPLEREGWPVLRLAAALANGDDLERARAALRHVGLFGGRTELPVVQRALARAELVPDAEVALADLGEPALELLAERMQDPDRAHALLVRLADRRPAEAVELLEALARRLAEVDAAPRARGSKPDAGQVRRVAIVLAGTGAPAVEPLLRLASDGVLAVADAQALLRTVPGAANALADLLRDRDDQRCRATVVVAAIEALRPVNGIAWLADRARSDRDARDPALGAIASYADGEAFEVLLRLTLAGPAGRKRVQGLLAQAIDTRPEAAAEAARRLHTAREREAAQELFELLSERPRPTCVPGWIALAASDRLPRSDRRSAIEAAGELGGPDDVPPLAALFEELPPGERELRAATLLALHRLGGRDGVAALFPQAPAKARDRLLDLLADPAVAERRTTTSFRVARELDALESATLP